MIVITGASDGLGREIARIYNNAGVTVVNISRRECEYASYNLLHNLQEGKEIKQAAKEVSAIDEPLEAIINCAAVMSIQPLGEVTEDEIKRVMSTNVKSAILLVSDLIKRIERDGTDIVNVASTVGTKGYVEQAAYGASKWALRGFSQNLQAEFKDKAPRVVSFCVGGMRTNMAEKIGIPMKDPNNWMDPAAIAAFIKQILELPKNAEVSEVIINRKAVGGI